MKAGCVERAIVSAGGPKLSCKYQGRASVLDGKRSMDIGPPAPELPLKRQLINETASLPSLPPSTYDYTRTENPSRGGQATQWGYCGSTNAYCGTGFQEAFGSCK